MKITDFLNSKETLNKVLDVLVERGLDFAKLPQDCFIAGGSVSNVLISMLHGGEPIVNDIDVYVKTDDKNAKVGNSWYPSMYTTEDSIEVLDDDYGRIYISEGGDRMRVVAHRRDGVLNIIQYAYEKGYQRMNGKPSTKTECELTIEGFDLNCCMAGIDLSNRKIVYNENFVDFLKTKQLKVVNPMAPIQTTIRIYKKLKDLDCYCNVEHEIRFLTVAFRKLTNNQLCKYIGPETEAKYRKYFDFVSKYFTIREPKNSDEIPHNMKDKYFIDTPINPNCKIWLYEPVMDFDIIEEVTSAIRLKRIWYLNYTPKKKSEQDKINKVFYKNVFTGNLSEDAWEYKEGWPVSVVKPIYASSRYSYMMVLAKKDYHKCDFTIKHLNVIDEFTKKHYYIRRVLSKLDTVSEQYKMVKFIKSLAKKEGEWIIGLLENVDNKELPNNFTNEQLVKFIEEEKSKDSQALVEPLNLNDFIFNKNIKELISNLQLKMEGTMMGHCVGGYGSQVERGYSRIFHVEHNGIGSTLELSLPNLVKPNYNVFIDRGDGPKIEEIIRSTKYEDKFIVRYSDDSTAVLSEKDLGYKVRQHQGRYPEKGNLTPTERNTYVATELVKFLNQKYFLEKFNIDLTENFAIKKNNLTFVE
jgi:hypothetical protein